MQEKETNAVVPSNQPKKGFGYKVYLFVKRSFDIFSSLIFLIVFSWLFLILAIAVKCSDGGKVFYRHERVGIRDQVSEYEKERRSARKYADGGTARTV